MRIDGPLKSFIIQRWDRTTLPNLAQIVGLVYFELADPHSHSGSLGKWNGIAEIEVPTSRLCRVREGAPVFLAERVLTIRRLQAQQFGIGGGL
jgi:hypothetical protein